MTSFLWLAHVVIPLSALRADISSRALPSNGRVAMLLRGQAFRHRQYSHGCDVASVPVQLNCTESLMTHIVAPLEKNHNSVELFVVNGNSKDSCPSFDELLMPKFGNRVVSAKEYESPNQADNMNVVLQEFTANSGQFANTYDLIIIVRHDDQWLTSISEWPTAEFDKFNLFSLCEDNGKEFCVNDNLHMMPGSLWKGFRDAIGTQYCFNARHRRGLGHNCYPAFAERMGQDNITFITSWRPTWALGVRGPNGIAERSR